MIEIAGSIYFAAIGSDVDRDGMFLEVAENGRLVATLFCSDKDGSFSLSCSASTVPLALVEWMIAEGKMRLPPQR